MGTVWRFPRVARPFLVGEIELRHDSIFRTLWELPTISQVWRAKERKMRLLRRWAVAKTLKMC